MVRRKAGGWLDLGHSLQTPGIEEKAMESIRGTREGFAGSEILSR